MKKENKKINKTNIFIGLLIGLAVLVFGGKILLDQNPLPEPKPLDQAKVDQMLEEVKGTDKQEENFAGTWKSEGEDVKEFTLNEDGTITDLEGYTNWSAAGPELTLIKEDASTIVITLTEDGLIIDEITYKK